jgi:heme/copper-type cytochrome/quinol oxidase subunit 1
MGKGLLGLISCGHKTVGMPYLWLALFSVVLGMALSVAMRTQISQSGPVEHTFFVGWAIGIIFGAARFPGGTGLG